MLRIDNLSRYYDRAIWIADDRLSAKIAQPGNMIEQIDFHGLQPVSRNAKLLQHSRGVLQFFLDYEGNGITNSLSLAWENILLHPAGICTTQDLGQMQFGLELVVSADTLQARCFCTAPPVELERLRPVFRIIWNAGSQTTTVHGCRTWDEPTIQGKGALLLKANDRIKLNEWLQRTGDYQGDFLIPEGWRRIIFKRSCVSGTATWQDVRDEYRDSELDLYNADTWIRLGADDFELVHLDQTGYQFRSQQFIREETKLCSPIFTVRFSARSPLAPGPVEAKFNSQRLRYQIMGETVPQLTMSEYPGIAEFFSRVPQIVESARVTDYGLTRACPGTYYWIWAWDNMVTAMAQCRWGDLTNLGRVVDFLRQHRDLDGSIPGRWTRHLEPMDSRGIGGHDFLFSELVMILYSETQDKNILLANYPVLVHAFRELSGRCRANGLFTTMGMYPDLPQKMGRDENSYVAIDSGAWYGLCRNLEKISWQIGDLAMAGRAGAMADKIETSFLPLFWDDVKGFLCDSCNPETMKKIHSYPLFSLLMLESPYGYHLLREKLHDIGRFLNLHLLGATGLSLTPAWDVNHNTEPAMSAWYPHWDFPAVKIWTDNLDQTALQKWLAVVEQCYQALGYCPEFLSLETPAEQKWQNHGAAWNLNCATGWYQALLHSFIGIETDIGGLTCHPAPALHDGQRAAIKKLCYRGGKWDIESAGKGDFITEIFVDDAPVIGTLKIPCSFYTPGCHRIKIQYDERPIDGPMLLSLCGAAVAGSESSPQQSVYPIQGFGRVDLRFAGARECTVWLDGRLIKHNDASGLHIGYSRLELTGEHELRLKV